MNRIRTLFALTPALAILACGASHDAGQESSGAAGQSITDTHPARLYLTSTVLARLQQRAAANDASWTALKTHCDGLATGTFNKPNGNAYPDFPSVGQGYQGDGYLPEVMALGLCYRVVRGVDSAREASYGAAGGRLLDAMATPVSSGGEDPQTDSGYGMRNYGVGMATGFDWLYPALSSTTKTNVVNQLNVWVDWYDKSGFSNSEPIGNYFAGYLLAKTTTAVATDGDNAKAATYWSDVQNRMWPTMVQPAYSKYMGGGGWPEGWQYGPRSVENMAQFLWAVKTGKGLDWWSQVPLAHDQALYASHFAWPSLKHMDDQGCVHAQAALTPSSEMAMMLAMILEYNGDPSAATARSFATDVMATSSDAIDPWLKFMYWDTTLSQAPAYSSSAPLSYFAAGPNHVSVRSSWAKDAVWGSFVGGQYIDAPDSGEQFFNQGSVTVVQGDTPIVVNATGWLPQAGSDAGEQFVYDDTWTNQTRLLYNTFYVAGAHQDGSDPSTERTHVEKFEDSGAVVHARARNLEDMYVPSGAASQVTRDFAYVRPGVFVVYDRTTVASASADQWTAWHTPSAPSSAATADATQRRYDVKSGANVVGSVRTLLPKNATMKSTSLVNGAAYRLEAHAPSASAQNDWLTVITAGGAVPEQTRLSAADGNVTAGNALGVLVKGTRNAVVLFEADHAATQSLSAVHYTVAQTADADHAIFDVAPSSTGYAITASVANGQITVDVRAGGSFKPTAQGTLAFSVSTTGAVNGAATPPPPAPPPAPPPTTDAGAPPPVDAGTAPPPVDAGTAPPPADAGTAPPPADAGTAPPPADAGSGGATTTKTIVSSNDAAITSQYLSDTGGVGGTDTTDAELGCYTTDGYTEKTLLHFDVSSIPSTATVTGATLTLVVDTWTAGALLHGSYLAEAWDPSASGFGWTKRNATTAWSSAGAGTGDIVAGKSFTVSGSTGNGDQLITVTLDASEIQAWIASAANNHGILLENPQTGVIVNVHASYDTTASNRPKLSVTFH